MEQELNKYKGLYIENEKVVDYQHDKLSEKDKEIDELKTRVSELQDKDWYEACIKQLEEQNDKLIKERDEIRKEVCDEIREKAEAFGTGITGQLGYMITIPLLNQIERG